MNLLCVNFEGILTTTKVVSSITTKNLGLDLLTKALLEDKEQFQVLQTGKDRFQNFRVRDLNEFVAS